MGLTEEAAREAYGEVETLTYDLAGNGKSQILKTQGFVKLVRQVAGPVVGVHLSGSRVSELISEAQLITGWEAFPDDVAALLPRPSHPERGPRRGASRAGRQAPARPRLSRTAGRTGPELLRPRARWDASWLGPERSGMRMARLSHTVTLRSHATSV